MENVVLKANKRVVKGKQVRALRRTGKMPAVVYGSVLKEPLSIELDQREASKTLRSVGSSTVLTVDVDGKQIPTLVRERQRNFLSGEYLHIDFLAISLTETVRTAVSIVLEGESPAVKDGGLLITGVDVIEVEALPQDLPEHFVVDLSVLKEMGEAIYVKDLAIPKGVDCLTDMEEMIAVVTAPSTAEAAEEVAEEELESSSEPEVIEKGKGDSDEEE